MTKPVITFFCELDAENLSKLFDGRFVIDDLKVLDARLSLGILDLSEDRAAVVKRLNKAGIPLVAWMLLPEEQGYWFNSGNFEQAAARYVQFKAWTAEHGLTWDSIGLDIEMDINDLRMVLEEKQSDQFVRKMFRRFKDKNRATKARSAYQALVDLIQADGYQVESYHIPLITEERRAKSTVLQRAIGLVDLETDLEVLMLYSSFLRPDGDAVLWSYSADADSVGVGNTGGGVNVAGVIDKDPLTWEEFSRDLRLCVIQQKPVHIFCLEGCVEQDFLSRLTTFDWDQPVEIPAKAKQVHLLRTGLAALLWLLERPWVIPAGLAAFLGLGVLFKRARRKKSTR